MADRLFGSGSSSEYDKVDRLIEQRLAVPNPEPQASSPTSSSGRFAVDRRYRYDRLGRLQEVQDSRWGATTYKYDPVSRLVEASQSRLHEYFEYDEADSSKSSVRESRPRPSTPDEIPRRRE